MYVCARGTGVKIPGSKFGKSGVMGESCILWGI